MKPDDLIKLTDQVAIITGGGGGIGRAIGLTLAAAGADIVIADNIPERCAETAERVRELGRKALPLVTDVSDSEQVRAMVEKADQEFGRVDILVNNAGGVGPRSFLDQTEKNWTRLINLNFMSMLVATSAAAPIMIRGGKGGAIINVASIEGSRAAPMFAVYAACKAGMLNFTRTMALELADHKIRVNAIAPDYTITPGVRGNISGPVDQSKWIPSTPEHEDLMARRIPLGRGGVDMECGNAALFLASNLSEYITGITLPVDGGTWASSGWSRAKSSGKWVLSE